MNSVNVERSILSLSTTRLVAYSDSEGVFTRVVGGNGHGADLATRLDILVAAAEEVGRRADFGALRTAIFSYADVLVLVGMLTGRGRVYIVSDQDPGQLGLLLSHLRNLQSSDAAAEVDQ